MAKLIFIIILMNDFVLIICVNRCYGSLQFDWIAHSGAASSGMSLHFCFNKIQIILGILCRGKIWRTNISRTRPLNLDIHSSMT